MRNLKKAEVAILTVLDQIEEGISDDAVKIVREFVNHNEAGVALDTLCSLVFEYEIELSLENKNSLKDAAFLVDIPLSQLDGFAE